MKVIPNSSGWDIALGFSFTDKVVAQRVATYVESAIYSLVRDAVGCIRSSPSRAGGSDEGGPARQAIGK